MGKLQDRRSSPAPVIDDTPEKQVLLAIFSCLLSLPRLCAFLPFTKTRLKRITGHELILKLFVRYHQYLTLADFSGEKYLKRHCWFKILSN